VSTQTEPSQTAPFQVLADMVDVLRPAAIRAAAALRVADHVAAGRRSVPALAEAVEADQAVLGKLMRYLAALGVFRQEEEGDQETYGLTELGELLRSDRPDSVRPFIASDTVLGRSALGLINVLHTVRTGEACHASVFGTDFWSDIQHDPAYLESLDLQLGVGVAWDAELVVTGYPWQDVHHVTDVGGGNGALLMELLLAHDHLRGRVVDLPNAVALASRALERSGLARRAEAVVGDFFGQLPTGSDVYLLSAVLADWSDARAVELLRQVGRAAGPSGKVLLAEVSLAAPCQLPTDMGGSELECSAAELYVAATVTAVSRGTEELVALAEAAGLRLTWTGPSTATRSLLEFTAVSL
jgi:predicted transcriptional regulator